MRLLFPRLPILWGVQYTDPWLYYRPTYIRWQESMLPNWNGSMMEFWSMQIQRVLSDGSAKSFAPSAHKIVTHGEFWPRVRDFLGQWVGPSYFVQEMQARMSPEWVPSYPLPGILQLRGQEPTFQWSGRERHHAGMFQKTGPLLGYGTPYTRKVSLQAARVFVAQWTQPSGLTGAPVSGSQAADMSSQRRYVQVSPTADMISRLAASSLVEAAAEQGQYVGQTIPLDTQSCIEQGLAMLKEDPQMYADVLKQAGSEAAIRVALAQSCGKLVAECGGMTLQQCINKLCPNMTPDQCKAVVKSEFGLATGSKEEESSTPWWLIGLGAGLSALAFGGAYWYAKQGSGAYASNPVSDDEYPPIKWHTYKFRGQLVGAHVPEGKYHSEDGNKLKVKTDRILRVQWVSGTSQGRSLEEALTNAIEDLGLHPHQVQVAVTSSKIIRTDTLY